MKVLFLSGRELEYPRNELIYRLFSQAHAVTYIGKQHGRASVSRESLRAVVKALFPLILRRMDLVVVGFFGQFIMLPVGLLARRPILFDAFISAYDTLCADRQRFHPRSLPGRLALWLDRTACRLADKVLLDTRAHARYFHETLGVPRQKLETLFVGCPEDIFYPRDAVPDPDLILFFGSYQPLHGVDVIVKAARLVQDECPRLRFRIIGSGQNASQVQQLAANLSLSNIEFLPPVPLDQLPGHVAESMICLCGHFGASDKARRVIAGKTFECIAMQKAVIVGENAANQELLTHGQDAWFCEMDNPRALADAVLTLAGNPDLCQELGKNARRTYEEKASNAVLKSQLGAIAERTLAASGH